MANVMRSLEEIESQLDEAIKQADTGESRFFGMSYEEGVAAALDWVLGHVSEAPIPNE